MNSSTQQLGRRSALATPFGRLARMMEIRQIEETIQDLYNDGHVRGSTHLCSGQEAVAVGLASVLRTDDTVACTYRGHGHALALGVTPLAVLGEICGRSVGCAQGFGGSMHLVGADVGLLPTFAIVGAGLPVACGAALAAQVHGTDAVSAAVFGDGSTNIGAFHEAMNLAAVRALPVLFVCENNLYGEYSPLRTTTSVADIAVRATAYNMPSEIVDGQDIDAVIDAVTRAAERARGGGGPTLLEMKTYRYSGHSRSDAATYRPPGELEAWRQRDPIELYAALLVHHGVADHAGIAAIRADVGADVATAVAAALAGPQPDPRTLLHHVTGT